MGEIPLDAQKNSNKVHIASAYNVTHKKKKTPSQRGFGKLHYFLLT